MVYLKISEVTTDKEEALDALNKAIEIVEEPTSLFMRFRINMSK